MPRRGLIVYSQSVVNEVNSLKSTFNLIKDFFCARFKNKCSIVYQLKDERDL